MKYPILSMAFAGLLAATQAWAVPVLQVGAPGGPGEGTYADYQGSTSNPTETDTAITPGGTLFVAGVWDQKDTLGGKSAGGKDWSAFTGFSKAFEGHGAILLVSVPDTTLTAALASLKVDNKFAFYSDEADSHFKNNHDPLKDNISDFLFFDIGNFSLWEKGVVPDFASETGAADGQIKTINVTGLGDLPWAHFDVMALETTSKKGTTTTSIAFNPGSHDVTDPPGEGSSGQASSGNTIPEPGVLALLSVGLLGQALLIRQRRRR